MHGDTCSMKTDRALYGCFSEETLVAKLAQRKTEGYYAESEENRVILDLKYDISILVNFTLI